MCPFYVLPRVPTTHDNTMFCSDKIIQRAIFCESEDIILILGKT